MVIIFLKAILNYFIQTKTLLLNLLFKYSNQTQILLLKVIFLKDLLSKNIFQKVKPNVLIFCVVFLLLNNK